jgi:hypothetical protein
MATESHLGTGKPLGSAVENPSEPGRNSERMHTTKPDDGKVLRRLYERINSSKQDGLTAGEVAAFIRSSPGIGMVGSVAAGSVADDLIGAADTNRSGDLDWSEFECFVSSAIQVASRAMESQVAVNLEHPSEMFRGWVAVADTSQKQQGLSPDELESFVERTLDVEKLELPGFAASLAPGVVKGVAAAVAFNLISQDKDTALSPKETGDLAASLDWLVQDLGPTKPK